MKKVITLIALIVFTATVSWSQEYKVNKSTGKLVIKSGRISIEGYNGTEVIFRSVASDREVDERARGLKAIDASGLDDNSGLGLNITDKGGTIEVTELGHARDIKVMVPKQMSVSFKYDGSMNSGKVNIKDIEGEVEIATSYNEIFLQNITGPLTVKSIYGNVDAKFGAAIKGPISIVSVYGFADVSMPSEIKATLQLSSVSGEIFASPDFKLEVEKKDDMIRYSANEIKGKLNGGGADIKLKTSYGKLYLRKS